MRRIAVLFAVIALVVAGARDSMAARATAFLDPLAAALQARVADVATPAKLKKLFTKDLKRLAKTTTTLAQDVASAAAILPAIEKKAAADTALVGVAGTTVDALAAAVAQYLALVQVQAAALHMKNPLAKIDKLLGKGQSALSIALGAGSILSRILSLRTAIVSSVKANNAVQKVMNGGGGGGGGGLCGPTDFRPAGIRTLGANESFALHLKFPTEEFDFAANTVTAKAGPIGGVVGQPGTLEIQSFDCTHDGAALIAIPYPPTLNVEYTNSQFGGTPGVNAWYGAINGLRQIFPGSAKVKATAFDQQAKTITIEFSFAGTEFTNGRATIRNWTGP